MNTNYLFSADIAKEVGELQPDSIISRTILANDALKVIIFGFASGQELSEHTASVPAIIHILEGEARLTLGGDQFEAEPGTWAHMPANMPHSVYAKTPTKMLLLMLKDKA
jgi:quercetin dioxygenase-like cupin family protein